MKKFIIDYGIEPISKEQETAINEAWDELFKDFRQPPNPDEDMPAEPSEKLKAKTEKVYNIMKEIMSGTDATVKYWLPKTKSGCSRGLAHVDVDASSLSFDNPSWIRRVAEYAGSDISFEANDNNSVFFSIDISEKKHENPVDEYVNTSNTTKAQVKCGYATQLVVDEVTKKLGSDWVINISKYNNLKNICEILDRTIEINNALEFRAGVDDNTKEVELSFVLNSAFMLTVIEDRFYDLLDIANRVSFTNIDFKNHGSCLKIELTFPSIWTKAGETNG